MAIRAQDMPEEIGVSTDFTRKGVKVDDAVDACRIANKIKTLALHHTKLQEYFTDISTRCDREKEKILVRILKLKEKLGQWVVKKGVYNPANDNHEAILPSVGTVYSHPGQVRAQIIDEQACMRALNSTGIASSCIDEVIIIKLRDKYILNKILNMLKKQKLHHSSHRKINMQDLQTLLRTQPKCAGNSVKFTQQEIGCEIIPEAPVRNPLSSRA